MHLHDEYWDYVGLIKQHVYLTQPPIKNMD